eukprot:TRINITY_DN4711_c0_g3_i2.p1 TRINITY_DN4711_c0_g3~~TRINITY_DN4711_c0_g3_i2.p1  ORF type:complete len:385 (+),score=94.03 TRINITY_DN4711_c0_g3_i2:382-1536(+)
MQQHRLMDLAEQDALYDQLSAPAIPVHEPADNPGMLHPGAAVVLTAGGSRGEQASLTDEEQPRVGKRATLLSLGGVVSALQLDATGEMIEWTTGRWNSVPAEPNTRGTPRNRARRSSRHCHDTGRKMMEKALMKEMEAKHKAHQDSLPRPMVKPHKPGSSTVRSMMNLSTAERGLMERALMNEMQARLAAHLDAEDLEDLALDELDELDEAEEVSDLPDPDSPNTTAHRQAVVQQYSHSIKERKSRGKLSTKVSLEAQNTKFLASLSSSEDDELNAGELHQAKLLQQAVHSASDDYASPPPHSDEAKTAGKPQQIAPCTHANEIAGSAGEGDNPNPNPNPHSHPRPNGSPAALKRTPEPARGPNPNPNPSPNPKPEQRLSLIHI